ncbi:hypothetical protein HMPREF1495_1527 [Lachnoanaerobaculum sp. MSX33]|uniref:McrB family protein n=1 Tax=Lachnoanaerobaculum sp. MSX33 TaxID=936596 RepID=UPI0003DFAA6C|nr:AAA family ATPase [Lachnoanaerobaculum sp. MSX33]ETO95057.1 hypothetical protein HMPREF1495_1527 [Lachnoanaerobaculum sp. MSX33]
MKPLTWETTFQDIEDLLKSKDSDFIAICKRLHSGENKNEVYKGYRVRHFDFLMGVVLGGYNNKDFIDTCYKSDKNATWSANFNNYMSKQVKSEQKIMDFLEKLDKENTKLRVFQDKTWLTNLNGKAIFGSVFSNRNEVAEQMEKMVNYLIKESAKNMTEEVQLQYNLLIANKQLIMNGAPGTGKTYSARNEIADLLLGISNKSEKEKEEIKKIQLDMVQFHPSYDYTDFIDGIRPDLSAGNLSYTLKNGSFKSFCRRAGVVERIYAAGKSVDANTINDFLFGEDEEIKDFWKKAIENANLKISEEQGEQDDETMVDCLPKFLFIIDEINRAEISKVLGEIMYCLDPDYRGKKGAISTQYSTLATDDTFFINKDNDKFFIPSNVYIIGTMNDIDRSVEVFDFALRRRFAWYEVKAKEVMDTVLISMGIDKELGSNYGDYKEKIEKLNQLIIDELKLNEHYHLGPSYFAKIKLYLHNNNSNEYKDAKEKVWDNHISQILTEYVKSKGKLKEIENIRENFIS